MIFLFDPLKNALIHHSRHDKRIEHLKKIGIKYEVQDNKTYAQHMDGSKQELTNDQRLLVDINTFEDLMLIVKTCGDVVISEYKNLPCIEDLEELREMYETY